MNKRAITLSVNFLVIVIISIAILGFGIKFIYDLYHGAGEIRDITFEDLDSQIEALLCEGNELACLGIDKKTLKHGDLGIFGLKIINMLGSDEDFETILEKGNAYDENGNPISPDHIDCVPTCEPDPMVRTETIPNNEEREIGLGIKVGDNADSGTYIFNLAVCYDDTDSSNDLDDGFKCDETQGFKPDLYYFDKIYVKVP